MTTPKAFKDLEAFSDYPSGYEPVVETQKQLIVQSMKKSKHQRQIAVIFTIAASVVILVVGNRFSVIGDQKSVNGDWVEVIGDRGAVIGHRKSVVGDRGAVIGHRKSVVGDRGAVIGDQKPVIGNQKLVIGNQKLVIGDQKSVISSQPKTKDQGLKTNSQPIADNRSPITGNRLPSNEIFLTKQRFKQFEFNRPPEAVKRPQEEKKKTEFFVFQNGNFKIINRPNQSQNTVIYTK
ncbi:MAG: hypothetical protein NBV77_00075 [Bacteroidia bacterium]|nr:hypothetical protein [Bacteroidia bacterium]